MSTECHAARAVTRMVTVAAGGCADGDHRTMVASGVASEIGGLSIAQLNIAGSLSHPGKGRVAPARCGSLEPEFFIGLQQQEFTCPSQ